MVEALCDSRTHIRREIFKMLFEVYGVVVENVLGVRGAVGVTEQVVCSHAEIVRH